MDKTSILDKHIEFKRTSVKSEEKIKDTIRYIKKFLDFSKKPLGKYEEEDLTRFINSLNYSTRTINDIKTYLKIFIKWNYMDWSSRFRNLERICKTQRTGKAYKPNEMISLKEINKIIEVEHDLMYKVYWAVFFYGGFRPSEACRLKWNDIDFDDGVTIRLHTTKTQKDYYKSLPIEVEHLLKEWKKYNGSEWVFPSPIRKDVPIVARSVCGRLKKLSKKAIGKVVVPYILRHSIATILYKDNNRKDDDTANQLGHNKSMKETYLNLDENELKSRARSLWIKPKKMSKETKDEYDKRIQDLEKELIKQKEDMKDAKFVRMKELSKLMKKEILEVMNMDNRIKSRRK